MFFYQLESEGKAGAERDGLYWNVHASCPARAGLHRLYADNGEETVCLGVMILERDKLCLRRRLSDRSFSFTGETTIYLDGKADSERSGQTCAEQPPKAEGGRLTILYREGEAFVMMEHFRAFRIIRRDGRFWWEAELNPDGTIRI